MLSALKIGQKTVGPGHPLYVIAEAGSNHNRILDKARSLIEIAADAGADAVKFQIFAADKLVSGREKLPDGTSLAKFFGEYELPHDWLSELKSASGQAGVEFLSSAFDFEAVDALHELGVAAFKIASGDLTNVPLVKHVASKGKPIILSTGMGSLSEVGRALEVISGQGCESVVLLHCISSYPSPPESMNLNAIETLRRAFGVPVGLSDHSLGLDIPIAATALGIDVLEKHYTDSRDQSGLDHSYSLEPEELRQMVAKVRMVQKALGSGQKLCQDAERGTRYYARRSIFAARDIPEGKTLVLQDLKLVRPEAGIKPDLMEFVIGRQAKNLIEKDSPITWDDI